MRKGKTVTTLFLVAAIYEGLLGLAFLFMAGPVFRWADITPPNHMGYVQFPGAILIIFGLMFLSIADSPRERRKLIPYGVMLKVAYVLIVGCHWIGAGVPTLWLVFAGIDVVFAFAFIWAYRATKRRLVYNRTDSETIDVGCHAHARVGMRRVGRLPQAFCPRNEYT